MALPSEKATKIVKAKKDSGRAHPALNYTLTARLWEAFLCHYNIKLDAYDVVQMLNLMKFAREKTAPHTEADNIDDIAGYANVYRMIEEFYQEAPDESQ